MDIELPCLVDLNFPCMLSQWSQTHGLIHLNCLTNTLWGAVRFSALGHSSSSSSAQGKREMGALPHLHPCCLSLHGLRDCGCQGGFRLTRKLQKHNKFTAVPQSAHRTRPQCCEPQREENENTIMFCYSRQPEGITAGILPLTLPSAGHSYIPQHCHPQELYSFILKWKEVTDNSQIPGFIFSLHIM